MRSSHPHIVALAVLPLLALGCTSSYDVTMASHQRDKAPDPSEIKDAPAPRISPRTHLAAGKMLERQNDPFRAVAQYEKAIAADPDMAESYNCLAALYQKLQRFEEAEDFFKRGIRACPESPMLLNNLGFCYLQQEAYVEAEREFRAALELQPDFSRARMNLAITMARTYRLGDSAVEFSRVVPAEQAYYNVAVILVDMEDYAEAQTALTEALALKPNYNVAKSKLREVTMLAQKAEKDAPPALEAEEPQQLDAIIVSVQQEGSTDDAPDALPPP